MPVIRILAMALLVLTAACAPQNDIDEGAPVDDSKLIIYAVNYPLAYMAERIASDAATIHFPTPADVDPAYWSPSPETIAEFQSADLILLNGAGYARWVPLATLPESRLVNTSKQFQDAYIPIEDAATHAHGPGGEHAHTNFAFTTWLDLQLALQQGQAIAEALIRLEPDREAGFRERLDVLEVDLEALDHRLERITGSLTHDFVAFSHPVYQYFQRRYGLEGFSVHWEPDVLPTAAQWRRFEEQLEEQPARLMLWEDEPLSETANRLRALGVESVIYRPLAKQPANGDFRSGMQDNTDRLAARAIKAASPPAQPGG